MWVFDEPDEKLYGTWTPDHRLNQKPVEAGLGVCRLDPLEHPRRFSPNPLGVAQIERNAADIALVRDIGRPDLEGDRETDCGGEGRPPGPDLRQSDRRDERKAIGREDGADLFRVEPGFSGGKRGCDEAPCR